MSSRSRWLLALPVVASLLVVTACTATTEEEPALSVSLTAESACEELVNLSPVDATSVLRDVESDFGFAVQSHDAVLQFCSENPNATIGEAMRDQIISAESEPAIEPTSGAASEETAVLQVIDQSLVDSQGYSLNLRLVLEFEKAVSDITQSPPGFTTATFQGVEISGTVTNTTPGRNLPERGFGSTLYLVYPAESFLCASQLAPPLPNGTCGIAAGVVLFDTQPIAVDSSVSVQGTYAGSPTLSGFRRDRIPEAEFDAYAAVLDDPIGMVAVAGDYNAHAWLPRLCTNRTVMGTDDLIIAGNVEVCA